MNFRHLLGCDTIAPYQNLMFHLSFRAPLYNQPFNLIWTGGTKMAPLRVFAKYLKNGLANLYETL